MLQQMSSKPLTVVFSPHNLQLSTASVGSITNNTSSSSPRSTNPSPRPRDATKNLASPIALSSSSTSSAAGNGIAATRKLTANERLEKGAAVYKADGPLAPQPISDPNLQPRGYPLDDILTPLERSCKEYLMSAISKDMIECFSLLAVERPVDPHLWLAHEILKRGKEGGNYIIIRRALDPRRGKEEIARDIVVKEPVEKEVELAPTKIEKLIPKERT